jgi:hypothetical protein
MPSPAYFERTVTISRPQIRAGSSPVGKQGYGGMQSASAGDDVVLFVDLPASIQYAATARTPGDQLSSSARVLTDWKIIIPAGLIPADGVTERDILTSDLGKRYQVFSARPGLLSFQIRASLLQL